VASSALMIRRMLAPLLAALLALAACSSNTPSSGAAAPASPSAAPATTAASPTPTAAATPTPTSCPNGRLPSGACVGDPSAQAGGLYADRVAGEVCPAILRTTADDRKNPDKMEPIGVKASASPDASLAAQGKLLTDGSRLARMTKGTPSESKIVTGLVGYADAMAASCSQAGFKP
jgi:hypothetical protein